MATNDALAIALLLLNHTDLLGTSTRHSTSEIARNFSVFWLAYVHSRWPGTICGSTWRTCNVLTAGGRFSKTVKTSSNMWANDQIMSKNS
jgi:hypothetical protein